MFARTFALTWLAYFGLYLCRRNFSVLMPYLKTEQGYSSEHLATVLFTYSVLYCAGQFLMGFLADRWGARLVVTVGMFVSAVCSSITGTITPLAAVQGVNGLAQSAGWPGLLKLTRDWFPESNRGVLLAWWSTHMVVGGFVATNLAAKVSEGGWLRAGWMPATVLMVLGVLFAVFARDGALTKAFPHAVRTGGLVLTPPLIAIAAMYFCVKMTRYAFLFWLPLYMTEALQYTPQQAGYASSVYELIGFTGVLAAGYLSDHAGKGKRFGVAAGMMGMLALLCVAYPFLSGVGWMWNVAAIALIGAVTFGPDTLMAGAAVQDAVPPETTASAAGFVNGVGSTGQILSPYVVSVLSGWLGWHMLFAVLGAASLVGAMALATQWRHR